MDSVDLGQERILPVVGFSPTRLGGKFSRDSHSVPASAVTGSSSICTSGRRSTRLRRLNTSSSVVISKSRLEQIRRHIALQDVAARRITEYIRKIHYRRKAKLVIRQFISARINNFLSYMKTRRYTQFGSWTRRQADIVHAVLTGWKTRCFLKSNAATALRTKYIELLRELLEFAQFYSSKEEGNSSVRLASKESQFVAFVRGAYSRADVHFLDAADKAFYQIIIRDVLVQKTLFRDFVNRHRVWVDSAVYAYWWFPFTPRTLRRNPPTYGKPRRNSAIRLTSLSSVQPKLPVRAASAPRVRSRPSTVVDTKKKEDSHDQLPLEEVKKNLALLDRSKTRKARPLPIEQGILKADESVGTSDRREAALAGRKLRIDMLTSQIEKAMGELKVTTEKVAKQKLVTEKSPSGVILNSFVDSRPESPSEKPLTPRPSASPEPPRSTPALTSPLNKKWEGKLPGHFDFGFSAFFKNKKKFRVSEEMGDEIASGPSEEFRKFKAQLLRSTSLFGDH